jgi:uncharacterized protein (DUF2141 family)
VWLLLATAALPAITAARAQDAGVFLPVPQEIPLRLLDGLPGPGDPIEIAHAIRGSVAGPTTSSALAYQGFDSGVAALPISIAPELPEEIALPSLSATATISVVVENVKTDTGTVNIGLCDKGLSRETCPFDKEVRASAGFVEATFDNIPPGTYAVVAYHDANGNGQFDRILGVPREPYALSGEAGQKMVPSFEDAALPIRTGENAVVIRLRRLSGN